MNCYNGQRYLGEAIKSVINQTYKNWELIFYDNCSTDNSKEIFKSFNDKNDDVLEVVGVFVDGECRGLVEASKSPFSDNEYVYGLK